MRRTRTLAVLAAALTAFGCTDLPLDAGGGSGGDFDISVGSGTQPSYSWAGGPALEVSVTRTANQTLIVWGVNSPSAQNIGSPVRHGTVPSGAIELSTRERTLAAGVQYRVTVKLANDQQAFQDFRP
jgi:hypothetical protein